MKKVFCILLFLTVCFSFVGCEHRLSTENTEKGSDPLLDTLLEDWLNLLRLQEQRYAQEIFALEKILEIEEENTWESYVYAQAASGVALALIREQAETELIPAMATEDYRTLVDRGMDVGDLQTEFTTYNEITRPQLADMDSIIWSSYYIQNMLYMGLDEGIMNVLFDSAEVWRAIDREYMKYWYLVNNYLLLELPAEYAERLMVRTTEEAPRILVCYEQPFESTNEVLNELNRVNNRLEELVLDQLELITMLSLVVETTEPIPRSVTNLPPVILLPESSGGEDWDITYYWSDGETIQTAGYLSLPEQFPNGLQMTTGGACEEDYRTYLRRLEEIGIFPSDSEGTKAFFTAEDGTSWIFSYADGTLSVDVSDGTICFAPQWYMDVLN